MSNEILVHSRQGHNIGIKEDTYGVEDWYCYSCKKWIERNVRNYTDHLVFFNEQLREENMRLYKELYYKSIYRKTRPYKFVKRIIVKIEEVMK